MRYVLIILAVCGIIVSSLALHVHYSMDVQPCSINERWDCGVVNHSRFAEVGNHIPVAAIGIAGYAVLGVLAALGYRRLLFAVALPALAYALYLTHIEADLLKVWCLYCVLSQGVIAVLTLLAGLQLLQSSKPVRAS